MRINTLLFARQDGDCVEVCPEPQPCSCASDQDCIIINRDCHTCSQTTCVAKQDASTPSGGASKGALAGGIVGAVVFLALSISLYFWYRRKSRLRKIFEKNRETQMDKPAPAEDVLNRPDPIEKVPVPPVQQPPHPTTSGHADPESHGTVLPPPPPRTHLMNPFDDTNSIQTTRTEGPNVIPIALVSPESHLSNTDTDTLQSTLRSTTSSGPVRPPRSPDLNLNLEHVNVSHDNLRIPAYAGSTVSGISGISRHSFMSGASYSSELLNEAPVIVTSNKGPVRHVLNVAKAEVVNASDGGKPPSYPSRPAHTSPLAATSFGPNDVLNETDEGEVVDPFHDVHSTTAQGSTSPAANNFNQASPRPESGGLNWLPDGPTPPWARSVDSRPSSISTQAGSIINIGSATRVHVGLSGLASPATASTLPRTPQRTTMARLISPLSGGSSQPGALQEQQARAFVHAQGVRRISGSSVVSATSTRADSILEAFPFVPPSPISDRPIRSPPVSPLARQSFTASASPASPRSLVQPVVTVAPASPMNQQAFNANGPPSESADDEALPAPPDRRTLGMSTGSQLSTTSTGLGSFPFQIDPGATGDVGDTNTNNNSRPNTLNVPRQRASLDTLALTSDLASYPLDFERDSMPQLPSSRQI
ncbi:hypothetical protein P691DRAFT_796336 [Macrolepiota fuliginosa MF-IS2]|uniref:Membrane anchor Opy2 N-terminal domain-containing protein n=1 Tax=Macrolepiota fuliginosa MF-IS2 TaxID=1400762 RepID=A0A9P6C4E4_9AGAR|nr:hypothetical protein P691DRAFT_796336 [Macrolepiota fuliginosa MF-IS2]